MSKKISILKSQKATNSKSYKNYQKNIINKSSLIKRNEIYQLHQKQNNNKLLLSISNRKSLSDFSIIITFSILFICTISQIYCADDNFILIIIEGEGNNIIRRLSNFT